MPRLVWTKEMTDYMREIIPGRFNDEVASMINNKFGSDITSRQVENYKKNNKLRSGLNIFKDSGKPPWNKGISYQPPGNSYKTQFKSKPKGTIVKDTRGYWIKKISDNPDTWEKMHNLIWKQQFGEIPEGHYIVFLDGDKDNLSIDNLVCLDKSERLDLNRIQVDVKDRAIHESRYAIIKLKSKIRKLQQ